MSNVWMYGWLKVTHGRKAKTKLKGLSQSRCLAAQASRLNFEVEVAKVNGGGGTWLRLYKNVGRRARPPGSAGQDCTATTALSSSDISSLHFH